LNVVAVDVGATNLRAALFSGTSPVRLRKVPTPRTSGDDLIMAIIGLIKEVSQGEDFNAIGVASIGPLDISRGLILYTPNLGYGNVRIRDSLGRSSGGLSTWPTTPWRASGQRRS